MRFGCSKEPSHRNISFECLKQFYDWGKTTKTLVWMLSETVLLNTQIVCFHWNKRAHNVGPPTACQRYAISMAYPWWAVDGPTLCASWNGDLMTLGLFKRRQYFVSKWFVNLHLTVIFHCCYRCCYMYIYSASMKSYQYWNFDISENI